MQSPELQNQIAQWRAKQAAGQMTLEDWKACLAALRQSRSSAQAASTASKSRKAPSTPVNIAALKDSLKMLRKPS
jgi:hypothetical protein